MKLYKKSGVLLCALLFVALSGVIIAAAETIQNPFDVSGLVFTEKYSDNFDGKTSEEIYAEWNGVVKAERPQAVTDDGWLMADWDTKIGVGYSFKQTYRNVRYDFDLKYKSTGSISHATTVFRSSSNAGNFYGGLQAGSTSGNVNGVAFNYFNSSAQPGKMTITVADSKGEIMNQCAQFELPYPQNVDFQEKTHVTVYDLDDRLLFFVENLPFAAVVFGGLDGDLYTEGTVYGSDGNSVGTFQKTVRRESNFAITARYSEVSLDNFVIAQQPAPIEYIEPIKTSVVYGTPYAEALNKLPNRAWVRFGDGAEGYMDITWDTNPSGYDGSVSAKYKIYGTLSSDLFLTNGTERVVAEVNVLEKIDPIESGETVLYQYMPYEDQLHMGYILQTKTGKLIVVDGGWVQSGGPDQGLFSELKRISGTDHPVVDAWFLTHIHADHVSEFIRIANENAENITVKNIYAHFPTQEQVYKLEPPQGNDDLYERFVSAFDTFMGEGAYDAYQPVERGDVIVVDDIIIEILQVPNGSEPSINDTSMPFRMTIDGQTITFLGDLAEMGGDRLYEDWGSKLKCDIVQMAHHGQDGVNENVYQMIDPSVCLWPTPIWLWDCQEGGSYRTWETKEWMAKLDVKQHVVAGIEGTVALKFPLDLNTYQPAEIIGVNYTANIYVQQGMPLSGLPETVSVLDNLLNERSVGVEWILEGFDTNMAGEYIITGNLVLEDELLQNSQGLTASVKVVVYNDNETTLIDFENGLQDFDSYYIEDTAVSMQGVARDFSKNWTVQDGRLIRVNDLTGPEGGTNQVAILTYNKQKFSNFMLSVDVKMGGDSYWWPVVAILQQENNGSYFLSDGLGLFIQQSGVATIWGSGISNPIEGQPISGYKNNSIHNITVTVLGGRLSFYVDGTLALNYQIPSDISSEGYISLMSVNNGSMFNNLVIREVMASDITKLNETIARAEALTEANFFYGWKDFQEALMNAKTVNAFVPQSKIDDVCIDLEAAMQALIPVGNPESLRIAVEEGAALLPNDYTQASYAVFAACLDAAESLLAYPASQDMLNDSLKAVNAARQALVKLGDKGELSAIINEYGVIERGSYTEESWVKFTEALENAKAVAAKAEASEEEIDFAVQVLNDAKAALKDEQKQGCQSALAGEIFSIAIVAVVFLSFLVMVKKKRT